MNNQKLAESIAEKLDTSEGLEAARVELLEALGALTTAVWYDTSPGGVIIVVLPGWASRHDSRDFVHLAMPGKP